MYELRLTNQSGLSIVIDLEELNGFTIKKLLIEDGLLSPETAMEFIEG